MLEPISASPGEDKGHHLVSERLLSLPLVSFFGMKAFSFPSHSLFVYGRVRLTMEGKSVVPMSVPVSIYGYLGLLQSSLGKDMADADVAF